MNNRNAAAAWFSLCVLLLAVTLTGGCNLKKQYPAKLGYLVEARRSGESRTASSQVTLRIRPLQVATAFEGKGFTYRNSELNYESDFYHEFLIAPRPLLTDQVRQWLGASALYRAVLDPASKAEATHSLEGNVSALYIDFREKASPKAVVAMEFFLMTDQAISPEIVFHRAYRQEAPLENGAPETLAKGWSKALEHVLTELERDLAKVPLK